MNIQFINLSICGFQSIGKAKLSLCNRGIVTITGVNNYENNAQSNGSGKSSIYAGLFWALYGKTPEGIINPTNRYSSERCQVSVEFKVDNSDYTIIRQMNKTSQVVDIFINGVKQSARNKSDSDKIIREDILRLSPELFLSLIYLSQGFGTRLSALTPTARKERLEQLTKTSDIIEHFVENTSKLKSIYQDKVNSLNSKIHSNSGSISTYENMIEAFQARLDKAMQSKDSHYEINGVIYTSSDIPELNKTLESIRQSLQSKQNAFQQLSLQKSQIQNVLNEISRNIVSSNNKIEKIQSDIDKMQESGVCPTCNQLIEVANKELLISEYTNQLNELERQIKEFENAEKDNKYKLTESDNSLNTLNVEINNLKTRENNLINIVKNIPVNTNVDVEQIKSDIANNRKSCEELVESNKQLQQSLGNVTNQLAVITHCQQLITKPFRAYLLRSTLDFLNSQLNTYSKYLFSNESDIIKVSTDSQKLDIFLGDSDYSTLSGGEKRRVDLAIMLAQRDLASEIAGMSSNILILDEIMESMDETATQVTLDLLENQSQTSSNLESMFIISHNNYAIPVDSRIVVVKGANRVSTILEN